MNAPSESPTPWVVDTTAERFELDVVERSQITPVVVDFWAAWCQPCRLLAPLLEKLAAEFAGRFVVVRANTDELPHIAAQFNVQSIPDRLCRWWTGRSSTSSRDCCRKRNCAPGSTASCWPVPWSTRGPARNRDPAAAERLYRQVVEQSPGNAEATIGLARVLLSQDRPTSLGR